MKNQYLAIVMFIAVSIIACGNTTEETAIDEQAVGELAVAVFEAVVEKPMDEAVEVIEDAATEQAEAPKVEGVLVKETKELNETPKVLKEIQVEVPNVKAEVHLDVIRAKHISWNGLTMKYVTSTGKVNYKGMKTDLSEIKTYLKHLEDTSPKKDWSKNEKLAYWINLYNASTVYLIASNYPISSITKLSGGKPWDKKFVKSGDKTYSLNDIENTIVRPQFKDPRIHAALNCAAVSCPNLLNGAYLPSKLNAQLDRQTRAWINDASKNKLNRSKAQVSQIFDWYKVDFKSGVVPFINKYISTGIALEPKAKITYLEYDWALNE